MCNVNVRMFDATVELKDNAMLKVRLELFDEWDFVKNDELGLNIYKVTKGSEKKAWWICLKCECSFDMMIRHKTNGVGCPYCSGRRASKNNSLASLRPDLALQWHPTKNDDTTPHDVAINSHQKAWWMGDCGHEWDAIIKNRNQKNSGCPYCSKYSPKILKGYNDMWTTNPELAKLLANPEDGYKYMQSGSQKADWKCPHCKNISKNKLISSINKQGLSCPNCSDTISYPEKVMHSLLKILNIDFYYNNSLRWSNGKKYDFYIPSLSLIVETNGEQHYEETKRKGKSVRTLKEEQENDIYKFELALENNIEHYVMVDCRISDFEYIKQNLMESELKTLLNLTCVCWDDVNLKSQKSINHEILELWNKGLSKQEIAGVVKVGEDRISRILRNFERLGMCKYNNNSDRGRKKIKKIATYV